MKRRIFARWIENCFGNAVVVHPESASEDSLLVSAWAPGESKSRSEVGLGGRIYGFPSNHACAGYGVSPGSENQIAEQALWFGNGRVKLVSQTKRERQIRPDFPIVLAECAKVVGSEVALRRIRSPCVWVEGILLKYGSIVGEIPQVAESV